MSCNCQICRDKPEPYIRQCSQCSNFHNWRLLPDGSAICGKCGHRNRPIERRSYQELASGREPEGRG